MHPTLGTITTISPAYQTVMPIRSVLTGSNHYSDPTTPTPLPAHTLVVAMTKTENQPMHTSAAEATRHTSCANEELAYARSILLQEADALKTCAETLCDTFTQAVDIITACAASNGTVLITGLGKSGLIGAKISATLASLGIPSHVVHPTEAAHGDLGRFRTNDAVIALSRSGQTQEVVNLAAILRQDNLPIIAITASPPRSKTSAANQSTPSSLEQLASVTLHLGDFDEAGAGIQAPTSSTTATLALGDALALAAARRRHFTDADFARRHPGGTLGNLLRPVTDMLRVPINASNPAVHQATPVRQAIALHPTNPDNPSAIRRVGAIVLVDDANTLTGIFTDADLRRKLIELGPGSWLDEPIAKVMTPSPTTLPDCALIRDAVLLFRQKRLDEIPIVDHDNHPVGILDVQDLIAMKLVRDTP